MDNEKRPYLFGIFKKVLVLELSEVNDEIIKICKCVLNVLIQILLNNIRKSNYSFPGTMVLAMC